MRHALPLLLLAACTPAPDELGRPLVLPAQPTVLDALHVALQDGGDATDPDLSIRWFVDGAEAGTGPTLAAGTAVRGTTVYATVDDGTHEPRSSDPVVVVNAAPVIASVALTPDPLRTDDVVAVHADVTDPDGDLVTTHASWSVGGLALDTTADTLDGAAFDRGDAVGVTVTATDDFGGAATGTASTVVADSAPAAPAIEAWPAAPLVGAENLVCHVLAFPVDADGDTVRMQVTWSVDGALYTGPTTTTIVSGDTVPTASLVEGGSYRCEVVAGDGTATSSPTLSDPAVPRGRRFTRVALDGWYETLCAVRDDGEVECHGANGHGQLELPRGTWCDVALYENTSLCAIDDAGDVTCLGGGSYPTALTRVPPGPFVDLALTGSSSAIGLHADGTLESWGQDPIDAPTGRFARLHVTASEGGCAVRTGGSVACWGHAADGVDLLPAGSWADVAPVGEEVACGVLTDGAVRCAVPDRWGWSAAPTTGSFTAIAATAQGACALDAAGAPTCWGVDDFVAPPAGVAFTELETSGDAMCGVTTDHDVRCFGSTGGRRLEPLWGTATDLMGSPGYHCRRGADGVWSCLEDPGDWQGSVPFDVGDMVELTMGGAWCGLDAAGAPHCRSQDYDPVVTELPVGPFASIASGGAGVCALDAAGAPTCWGTRADTDLMPRDGTTFERVVVGSTAACWLDAAGAAHCTAAGKDPWPAAAYRDDRFLDLAVQTGACGVRRDGSLLCWGLSNGEGPPPGTFFDVDLREAFGCAVGTDLSVRCWRFPTSGSSGAGTYERVPPAGRWLHVDVGDSAVCALGLEGRVRCWGSWWMD